MKRIIFFLIILHSINIYSQDNKLTNKINFELQANSGIIYRSNNDLNDFLSNNDYYPFSNEILQTNISFGFRMRNVNDPLMAEIMFNNSNKYNIKNSSSIDAYGININAFYKLNKSHEWILAPEFGFSLSNYNLTAMSKNIISTLSGNTLEESFTTNNVFGLKFGINIEREILIYNLTFSIGLNAFYCLDIGERKWFNSSNSAIQKIPSMGMSGVGLIYNLGLLIN